MKCAFLLEPRKIACRLAELLPVWTLIVLLHPLPVVAAGVAWKDLHFDISAPYGAPSELSRRLGARLLVPSYQLTNEMFHVGIPESYSTNDAWGLLVWVSPGADPRIPGAWGPVLDSHQLLFVSARKAGNERDAIERCRLALDATCNMTRRFRIDPKRIYVGGFSGGGRIASILGVAYADLFRGTLGICGVDFYQNVPAGAGLAYPATYRPAPAILQRAKLHGRFALLTGDNDPNRDNTKQVATAGFTAQGFRSVRYIQVARMGHTLPGGEVVSAALDFLDESNPVR